MNDCTVTGNTVSFGAGGGGIRASGTLSMNNCTVSGNNSNFGSGILIVSDSANATITSCTIANNSSSQGLRNFDAGLISLKNSIVAGNGGADVFSSVPFSSQGNNLIGNVGVSSGWVGSDKTGTAATPLDARLGPLANYGGPTATLALMRDSPAIDMGVSSGVPAIDQRGVERPQGAAYDIGAFEANITLGPTMVPVGAAGLAYTDTTFTATGGTGPYTFTSIGTLPNGMSFTNGTLGGTPLQSGNFTISVIAADADGFAGIAQFLLTINCASIVVSPVNPQLPSGTAGQAYSQTVTAVGGSEPYGFIISTGTLPPGLTLSSSGTLSGTPTGFGLFNFTVRATDSNNCFGERAYTLHICGIILPTASVAAGTTGVAYNQTITASGGASPYSFAVSGGNLPPSLSLNSSGALSGTPTQSGSFNFTVIATDALGCTGAQNYTLTVNCQSVTVNPASLPNGFVGTAYNQSLTAAGGTAPYTFTVAVGDLPDGLSLSSGGIFSGALTTTGTFSFTVITTDANGCQGLRAYTVITSSSGLMFYPLPTPVRLLETRSSPPNLPGCNKPNTPIAQGSTFTLLARTVCAGIPTNAAAVTGNITVVPAGAGYLTLFPGDAAQPTVANSNFKAGEVTNNVFTLGLASADGTFKIFASATADVIIDVTGYYAPPGASGLYYHSLSAPVRLLQTFPGQPGCILNGSQQLEGANDPNANPALDLVVQGRSSGLPSHCNAIPNDAVVLVGNATTVFPDAPFGFGYLTIYPSDETRPTVASSNYGNNDIINGPFAVKLGADGQFKVYTFSTTHLVIDISGYYSASPTDANGAGLLFNPLPKPIRLLETRNIPGFPLTGCDQPQAPIPGGTDGIRTQQTWGSCSDQPPLAIPTTARALVGNATVINPVNAGFGTFFPGDAGVAPTVATTNYPFPAMFGYNRHYYVGLSPADGTFKVLMQFTTDLILDVSGYFAP